MAPLSRENRLARRPVPSECVTQQPVQRTGSVRQVGGCGSRQTNVEKLRLEKISQYGKNLHLKTRSKVHTTIIGGWKAAC